MTIITAIIRRGMVFLLAGALTLLGTAPAGTAPAKAAPAKTALVGAAPAQGTPGGGTAFRAMWVATVYNLDYPFRATVDAKVLKAEADEILQGCADMGMTAVILQVRPSCDALYPSEVFPWSRYLTGTQGTAPSNGFDPLAYWVERAHALGLELHAWINPFRITKGGDTEYESLSAQNPAVLHPDWVVKHEGNYYLNPGLPQVRELVVQGAEELVRKYDIDGVHLDDYFYPGSDFDDAAAFAQYGAGFSDLGNWRRDNINQLIQTLGERLHAIDPDLSYGVSPSGVWADRTSLPEGSATTGGYESYYASYADSRKWVQEGWVDYICPQIYWYIGHPKMDYATIARWWADTVRGTGVSLYIGMADYQAGNSDPSSAWYGVAAIGRQLELNSTIPEISGEVHFRYKLIAQNAELKSLYQTAYGAEPEQELPPPAPAAERPYLGVKDGVAYIQGADGLFRPDDSLSRAEAVVLLARLSVDEAGEPLYTGAQTGSSFSDVDAGAWYAPYVAFAVQYGITGGYPDGTFRPNQPISRAELVKLTAAYFELAGGAGEASFADVAGDHWAAEVIAYAAAQGWISGYPDGTFRPEQGVSRAEAVKILNQALGREAAGAGASPFADITPAHWAYGEILAACGQN